MGEFALNGIRRSFRGVRCAGHHCSVSVRPSRYVVRREGPRGSELRTCWLGRREANVVPANSSLFVYELSETVTIQDKEWHHTAQVYVLS
jgi:hypothetical protein